MKSTEKKRVVVSEIFWSLERIVLVFDALEYAARKGNSPVNIKEILYWVKRSISFSVWREEDRLLSLITVTKR